MRVGLGVVGLGLGGLGVGMEVGVGGYVHVGGHTVMEPVYFLRVVHKSTVPTENIYIHSEYILPKM